MKNEINNCDWKEVYNEQWKKHKEKEKYISGFIKKNLANDSLETVLVKVMLINDFYGTNIFDTLSVAKHIFAVPEIDTRMAEGDLTLVIDIGKMQFETKNQYLYSFATKYCSFHNSEGFLF